MKLLDVSHVEQLMDNSWTANQQEKTCLHMGHNPWHYSNIEGKGCFDFQCLKMNIESWLKICTSYQVYGQIDKIFLGMIVHILREERWSKDNKQKRKKERAEPYQTIPMQV
jgi:hypothetical protein